MRAMTMVCMCVCVRASVFCPHFPCVCKRANPALLTRKNRPNRRGLLRIRSNSHTHTQHARMLALNPLIASIARTIRTPNKKQLQICTLPNTAQTVHARSLVSGASCDDDENGWIGGAVALGGAEWRRHDVAQLNNDTTQDWVANEKRGDDNATDVGFDWRRERTATVRYANKYTPCRRQLGLSSVTRRESVSLTLDGTANVSASPDA